MTGRFLGIDGGGTKTEFVCIDDDGRELAGATLGTTYHLEIGVDEVVARLNAGVAAIAAALGIGPDGFDFVFFGLPAFGEDRAVDPLLDAACGRLLGHDRYRCGNDMVCGWAGSLGAMDGINIVAGTGSIGYGERGERWARAGGWGEILGDEGSAYWIARQGLTLFSRMSDGRATKGLLYEGVRQALALDDDLELCERMLGARAMGRGEVAALAPLVTSAADAGDTAAIAILDRASDHLIDIAETVQRRLGYDALERTPISASGSVLRNIARIRERFLSGLDETSRFSWVEPRYSPAYGAALYARRILSRPSNSGPTP